MRTRSHLRIQPCAQGSTKAEIFGSTAFVSPGQSTKRYQELLVLALIACHDTSEEPPGNLLTELAKEHRSGPRPAPHAPRTCSRP
jgi:hypothetical protein